MRAGADVQQGEFARRGIAAQREFIFAVVFEARRHRVVIPIGGNMYAGWYAALSKTGPDRIKIRVGIGFVVWVWLVRRQQEGITTIIEALVHDGFSALGSQVQWNIANRF